MSISPRRATTRTSPGASSTSRRYIPSPKKRTRPSGRAGLLPSRVSRRSAEHWRQPATVSDSSGPLIAPPTCRGRQQESMSSLAGAATLRENAMTPDAQHRPHRKGASHQRTSLPFRALGPSGARNQRQPLPSFALKADVHGATGARRAAPALGWNGRPGRRPRSHSAQSQASGRGDPRDAFILPPSGVARLRWRRSDDPGSSPSLALGRGADDRLPWTIGRRDRFAPCSSKTAARIRADRRRDADPRRQPPDSVAACQARRARSDPRPQRTPRRPTNTGPTSRNRPLRHHPHERVGSVTMAPERFEIKINAPHRAVSDELALDSVMLRAPRPKAEAVGMKLRIEDGREHLRDGLADHPIHRRRHTQLAHRARGLGDHHRTGRGR